MAAAEEEQLNEELRKSFLAYCSFIRHDSTKGNSSTVRKMCTDTGINKSKMKQNDIDLEYARCFRATKEAITFEAFLKFVTEYLAPVYGKMNGIEKEDAIKEVKTKLATCKPSLSNTTKFTDSAVTKRLIDPNLYPTSQKDKFNPEKKRPATPGQPKASGSLNK